MEGGLGRRCRLRVGWRVLWCTGAGRCDRLCCCGGWAGPSFAHDFVAGPACAARHGVMFWSHWAVASAEKSASCRPAESGRGARSRCLRLCGRCGLERVDGGWHWMCCSRGGMLRQGHLSRWNGCARLEGIRRRPWRPWTWHSLCLGSGICLLAGGGDGCGIECGGWCCRAPRGCGVSRWCSWCWPWWRTGLSVARHGSCGW